MKLSTVNAIPIMTSNTSPSGIASASGIYGSTNDAFKAFDNDSSSYWRQLNNNGVYPQWLQYEFVESIIIGKYEVQIGNLLTSIPTSWTFEGGNGISFEVLDTQSNLTWSSINEIKSFVIDNNKEYKVYRLTINSGTSSVRISSLNMYELTTYNKFLILSNDGKLISKQGDDIRYLPSQSENNFINHGMDKSAEIDLNSQITSKVFIEQNSTTLGNGKVFSKTIDTTKTPIKKVSIN